MMINSDGGEDNSAKLSEIDDQTSEEVTSRYKLWKKHVPFLYDTLFTQALTWPSLTVEWLPSRDR